MIYVFGGISTGENSTDYNKVYKYDPSSNQWSVKASMPEHLFEISAHTVNNKIYIFGGYGLEGFNNSVLEYDPQNDTWEKKTPIPAYRYLFQSGVVNGKIYIIGGQGTIDDGPWESGKDWEVKREVEIYDPVTDSWSIGADAPINLYDGAACALNGDIFIFGGKEDHFTYHENNYRYSTSTDSWTMLASNENIRNSHACVASGDKFYLFGGWYSTLDSLDEIQERTLDLIEVYSPESDTLTEISTYLPTPKYNFTADIIGTEVYLVGGKIGEENITLNSLEIIDINTIDQ